MNLAQKSQPFLAIRVLKYLNKISKNHAKVEKALRMSKNI